MPPCLSGYGQAVLHVEQFTVRVVSLLVYDVRIGREHLLFHDWSHEGGYISRFDAEGRESTTALVNAEGYLNPDRRANVHN